MRYKKGDKVKIKTWDQMEQEFGLYKLGNKGIDCGYRSSPGFYEHMEEDLGADRTVTIKYVYPKTKTYAVEESSSAWWNENMVDSEVLINDSSEESTVAGSDNERFNILDL